MSNELQPGMADIIVPVHDQFSYTRALLEGIYRYSDCPFHLYIIDNASTDETVDLHKIYTRDITIVRNRENRGWSSAINQGFRLGRSPFVFFLTNDIEVSQGWMGNLIAFLNTHPRIGAVGPLISTPGHWQCVDKIRDKIPQIPNFFTEDLHERNRILGYHFHRAGILVEGLLAFCCVVLTRRAVNHTGPLDETGTGGGEEVEYCRRLRKAGYVLGLSLDTYVMHHAVRPQELALDATRRKAPRKREFARPGEGATEYL